MRKGQHNGEKRLPLVVVVLLLHVVEVGGEKNRRRTRAMARC